MTLTTKELIQKLIDGEKLTSKNYDKITYCYYDETYDYPFRYIDKFCNIPMDESWNETEWETYKETPKWWEPKDNEKAYFIDMVGCVYTSNYWNKNIDKNTINQGNVFKTREEAEKEVKLRAAKYRVKKRVWELNDGEFIKFKKDLPNWSFSISRNKKIEAKSWYMLKFFPHWQYLKTEKLTQQLIDEMYNDLLLIRSE